ncbi:MAG: MFS transporter [Betaproteobacteria bacterium RBG_16_64_18]|nr:MAG: MFS transporter [Betaproteobacteria bacterium RBG_16_64_18]OGA42808.1 MAG: MFS transporter [Betaproteobacteria bacterium RIFCSPLOWO2_12_FULL_65_110]
MQTPGRNDEIKSREVFGWAMYDFANSGYTTVVITAVFNAYFVTVVAGGRPWATFAWTLTLSVSYAAIVLSAPLVGAWADVHAAKKRLLGATTAGCVVFTALLAQVGPGDVALAVVLVAASNFFFGTGENLVAAFLPELARGSALGKVSGWGWSLGYIGGLLTLGLCLAYVTHAQGLGAPAADYVPVTMLITAGMFAAASAPTFLLLRERARPQPLARHSLRQAYARVLHTLRHAAQFRDLRRFLACLVFYQAGVQAVITIAAVYAHEAMGFTTRDSIVLILAVNVTAALGAFTFGQVQDRLGHVPTIALTLAGWIVTVALAWLAEARTPFWIAANLAGLCLGASQSAARALVAYLSPADRRAEFFGLWGLAVKLSSILGPITYGAVSWVSLGNHRLAMLITGAYFVVGLVLLAGIDPERGRRAAGLASGSDAA